MKLRNSPIAIALGGTFGLAILCALMAGAWVLIGLTAALLVFIGFVSAVWLFLSLYLSGERQAANSELSGAPEGGRVPR